jgi:hypothetical protein
MKATKDERISQARRHIATTGFGIWYVLLLGMLLYRQFVLRQPWHEYWDIALAFFIGTAYVTIASFARGAVYETQAVRFGKWMFPGILVTIVVVLYLKGGISTAVDLLAAILSASISISVLALLLYYLYRRWEKRHNLVD